MTERIERAAVLTRLFPIIGWLRDYPRQAFGDDLFAGIITAILLVPQGIAYAMLAGLPPQLGLYASILPPAVYAVLGTSRALSVGPVSIAAIMIASALAAPEIKILGDSVHSALVLSAECGVIMLAMAALRMGGLVNFISHPVLTGFTTGAALLIMSSQIQPLLGVKIPACGWDWACYPAVWHNVKTPILAVGLVSLLLLVFFGQPLATLLKKLGLKLSWVTAVSKAGPLLTVGLATWAVGQFDLNAHGVALVGAVPAGLPPLDFTFLEGSRWRPLLPYAAFIALIAYVESVAIAKVTANLRGEKIAPNQELVGLGFANLASALTGGMLVAGGFSRTMVNFSAGARSQLAMLIAASLLAVAVAFFSTWFEAIPQATLAAIILVAIFRLVRLKHIVHTWRYDPGDGKAELATLLGVLALGLEEGIAVGIALTIACNLRKASQPHIAIVGRIPETEHYRNVKRHSVQVWHHLLLVRIDESITFANVGFIEEFLHDALRQQPNIRHIVLICNAVNDIDSTALEALESFNHAVKVLGKTLNLAETKGPVLDKLQKTDFLQQLVPGQVFFRTEDAVRSLG